MKKLNKIISALLAATLTAGLCACNKDNKDDVDTLVWCLPANDLSDKEAVIEEINKITIPEIGAKVEIQEYDYGTYTEKIRMKQAAGDDEFDIMFVGYLNNYIQAIQNGTLEPLNELIDEYAPELWDTIPEYAWADANYDGMYYAVPNTQIMATQYAFGIQKTLAEKYGWTKTEIEKPEELEEFLQKVKENEPLIYPYRPNYGLVMWTTKYANLGCGTVINQLSDSNEVVFLRNTPEYIQGRDTLRDWFNKGYIRRDVASVGDDNSDFNSLRYAVYNSTWKPGQETQYPDYMYVKIGTPIINGGAALSTMNGINYLSKNKEKAIKLIALINTNPELYNLMALGIKDKHYTLDEAGKYTPIEGSGYGIAHWAIGNQFNALIAYNQDDDVWEQTEKLNAESKKSKLMGYVYNGEDTSLEASAISAIMGEYECVNNGSRDKADYWDIMNERLEKAGEDRALKAIQDDINSFFSEKEE